MITPAVLLLAGLCPSGAAAAGRAECSVVPSAILRRSVPYCALLPADYDGDKTGRYAVLYFLHGLGQNERALIDSGGWALVEDLQRRGVIGRFLIVTPAAGISFYVNSRDGRQRYEDFFLREFIPAIERRYRAATGPVIRGISGVSMGGYGALRFAFKYPQMFGAVSAHSAALVEQPPANLRQGLPLGFLEEAFGSPPDSAYWVKMSPFTLVRESKSLGNLKIYFDCGTEDDFGFDQGNRALSKLLASRGMHHEFHMYPGGHGWRYIAQHLPASLEFHSRAFGLPGKTRR
jgi:S-formylglutathione hydrolase FrmB